MASGPSDFRLLSKISGIRPIARGRGIDILDYLRSTYGGTNWIKLKGIATVEDESGWIGEAEIHWFEAHGVGRVLWKIKRRFYER